MQIKIMRTLLLVPLFMLIIGIPVYGEPLPNSPDTQKQAVKLTKNQQAELTQLHLDLLNKKKQLISKYVEYGVLSKEKGDKMLARINEHYNEIKQKGSVQHWNHMHHHHHHHDHDQRD